MDLLAKTQCPTERAFGGGFTWRCIRSRHFGGNHYMRALRIEEDVMAHLPAGHVMTIEGLPGRWQVWSQSGNTPGAYFFVPSNEEARAADIKYVEVRVIYKRAEPKPTTQVIHAEHIRRNT